MLGHCEPKCSVGSMFFPTDSKNLADIESYNYNYKKDLRNQPDQREKNSGDTIIPVNLHHLHLIIKLRLIRSNIKLNSKSDSFKIFLFMDRKSVAGIEKQSIE